jgi:UDP-N-acetylmuramate dehydrogenase
VRQVTVPALRLARWSRRVRSPDFIWFRTGGPAEWLVRPKDIDDLARFLGALDPAVPVMPVGVGSNLIVRDGGVPGWWCGCPRASPG